ncbi:MAG: glutamyl-tRNA reductase [Saprospiraceae bacterium]|nr:glutamyl-tRNA reductase [Saprospiraceae bacterium]
MIFYNSVTILIWHRFNFGGDMLNYFQVISISHEKLETEDLEQFIIKYKTKGELKEKLTSLKNSFDIEELIYLSTCNRLMILMFREDPFDFSEIKELLEKINPNHVSALAHRIEKVVNYHIGSECIRHLFEVASSLQSLVIGEREIFRQFRSAYNECKQFGLTGDNLRLLERCTVSAAKDVYTSTKIGEKPVSIVSLALQSLLNLHPNRNKRVLMVGSGETNTTFGRFLKKHGFGNIVIFNRSFNNAFELSEEIGASAYHLSDLNSYEKGFDIMICCTSATEPVINSEIYRGLVREERDKKVLIDLSIPNNISKNVVASNNVTHINIDSLRSLAQENLQSRQGNIAASRILINYHLDTFTVMYDQRQIEKAFSKLPKEIKSIKDRAIEKVFKQKIEELPEASQELLREMMDYMEKKCVAAPIKLAKELAEK